MNAHTTSRVRSGSISSDRGTRRSLEIEPLQAITADDLEQAKKRAHELRAEAMTQMLNAAAAWVRDAGRRLVSLLTNAGERTAPCNNC